MAKVLILCPTFDHADTLFASIASVRAQTFAEWEMAVICDGSPPRTYDVLRAIIEQDARIRFHRHPKSERYGEAYRDPVIRDSEAEFICHLSDDDIWACDHLARMLALLERAEWANQAPLRLSSRGQVEWMPFNAGTQAARAAMARRLVLNAGINYVGYRRDAYLRLSEGWTCAPWEAGPSDLYMWAKFFALPQLSVASSAAATALKFPSRVSERTAWTPERRLAEITPWLARAAEPGLADGLRRSASLLGRMIAVFGVHGAGPSLEEASARAGLSPAPADAPPQPALNGEPMILPLTQAQRDDVRRAHLFVWAFMDGGGGSIDAAYAAFEESPQSWLPAANNLANVAGVEAGLRAVDAWRDLRPDHSNALIAAVNIARRGNRSERAERYLEELARRWPGHPALARLRR